MYSVRASTEYYVQSIHLLNSWHENKCEFCNSVLKKNQKKNNNIDWSKTFELSRKETLSLNIVKNNDNRNRCYDTIIQ